MSNPVTIGDLEARFRPLSEAERTPAQAWLDDAWEELLARVPDVPDRMTDGRLSDGLVRRVVAAMVVRVLRNPDAIRQWQADDGSFTRDTALSSGMLYVTPEELALLTVPQPEAAAFTIRPKSPNRQVGGRC